MKQQVACVDIRALPLQRLLYKHSDWKHHPAVVVDRDKPTGIVLWANARARALRIFPGMAYATGLALSRDLRGGVVSDSEIQESIHRASEVLWTYSPRIEPSDAEPGIFWLDTSGLGRLYPSLNEWAASIREDLMNAGFQTVVAVGFSRFGVYAAAKSASENCVFRTEKEEQAVVKKVALQCLHLSPQAHNALEKLAIHTIGQFVGLPSAGIMKRFGEDVARLYEMAKGEGWTPLMPLPIPEPVVSVLSFEWPETDIERLLVFLLDSVSELLAELEKRHEALLRLCVVLTLDDASWEEAEIAPATPTLDTQQILALLKLRLETLTLSSGIVEMTLRAIGTKTSVTQYDLLEGAAQQSLESAHRVLARIKAELGNDAVMHAVLGEGHLPEATYHWQPVEKLPLPKPVTGTKRFSIRRIYTPPRPLPSHSGHLPDGWMLAGLGEGPVEEVVGPHTISGGWWVREVSRAYHYVRTRSGRWLWVFYDKNKRRWFLHAEVQ